MGAFNTLNVVQICPSCKEKVKFRIQFKYGDTWQHEYKIGDQIQWGGNDIGKPGLKRVVLDGTAEHCPKCGYEDIDYEILIGHDKIISVQQASNKYDFVGIQESYIVIEE